MLSRSRRSCSARSATLVNSALRWLISMTDRPLPCPSSNSAWAFCRTASGSAAGPAQKLNMRLLTLTSLIHVRVFDAVINRGIGGIVYADFLFITFLIRGLLDSLQTDQFLVVGQLDQGHALGVARQAGYLRDPGAHQCALVRDQHDLLAIDHLNSADQRPVTLVGHHGDHALAAAPVLREVLHRRALAVAVLRSRQDLGTFLGNQHGHQ